MTYDSLDDMLEPQPGPPTLAGEPTPRKCRRHQWAVSREVPPTSWCTRCGNVRDDARSRRNKNNRSRGNKAELTMARAVNGRKVGPLGHPWDVEIEGYMRLQVKKLATWPSVNQIAEWLDAIPLSPAMRGVALVQPGRGGRQLLILDFKEFAQWHTTPKVDDGD